MLSPTLREFFYYNSWAHEKVLASAGPLTDAQLDRKFEMGLGSIRATLFHLWGAERVWLDRWIDPSRAKFPQPEPTISIRELGDRLRGTAAERAAFLADTDINRRITYTNMKGEVSSFVVRDLLLHVCIHATHHRAQIINMLRHVGAELPKPAIDYIFMRIEKPDPTVQFDLSTLREFFRFSDWARARVHTAAAKLSDAQLDQSFEMGVGTLRKTLSHIRDAEQWWLDNWTQGPGRLFPAADENSSVSKLGDQFDETAAKRNDYISKLTDADLHRIVKGTPRPNVVREFPVGVTLLQLCNHSTHHRAQALNMIRRLGGQPPASDYLQSLVPSQSTTGRSS